MTITTALTALERQTLEQKLQEYEGYIEHMYLDTNGNVTIGIGHLVSSQSAAAALRLYKPDGTVATPDEIKAEYQAIKALPYGNNKAVWYKTYTTLTMKQEDIHAKRDAHILESEKQLKILYPGFNSYPTNVRLALFDMIFNLGMGTLNSDFPSFNAAIKAGNWKTAATESRRKLPKNATARNDYVRQLLEEEALRSNPPSNAQ